jgi:hypothetical protein
MAYRITIVLEFVASADSTPPIKLFLMAISYNGR